MGNDVKQGLRSLAIKLIPSFFRYRYFHRIDAATIDDFRQRTIEPELRLLRFFLDPHKAFIDIGANRGEYIYAAGQSLKPSQIYAFEPQSAYGNQLRHLFPEVHVVQCALSSKSGAARLKVPLIRGVAHMTRGTLESFVDQGENSAYYEDVTIATLDEMLTTLAPGAIGCIKIDVEGHEGAVLAGATRTLEKSKPVLIVEIEQRHHAQPIGELFQWLDSRGYDGYFFDLSELAFKEIQEFSVTVHQRIDEFMTGAYINNFIFVPRGRAMPPGPINL